ncbi:tetratricopeptide repeat protein [Hymenobacter weizhouensis]|uniref:tetratricopeptide repeat protein n=1 Tax=Hymenobacter sp. YIM 151500-1 TaxID=2987689 RepID=UPI0022276969|nr:tetratricopeptide repeat protein [Hymenobacter sp. YIM 151500-1]UYZ62269.1 tetratricopeptide repeat protein [Hymenobacter sp. YIM 151500-1]
MKALLVFVQLLVAGATLAQPAATLARLHRRLAATAPTDTSRVRMLDSLAIAYQQVQFDSAWTYATRAYELAQSLNDQRGLFGAYKQLGILNGIRGNDEASLRLFLAQLRLADKVPGKARFKPAILSNIAHSYFSLGRYDQALAMLHQARRLDELARDTVGVLSGLGNIAEVQMTQGQAHLALQTITQALALRRRYSGPRDWTLDVQMASALLRAGRPAAARDTCLAILPHLQRGRLIDHLAHTYNCLLKAYHQLGQPAAAEQAGQAALAYARQAGQLSLQRDVLETLAELAADQQNFAAAYRRRQQAGRLTDSLTRASNAKTVQDLQFRYETERKEAQIRALAQEARSRRWQVVLWSGVAVLGLVAAALLYRSKRLQNKVFRQREQLLEQQREQSEARRQLQEAARAALQLQLDSNQRELASATLYAQQKTKLLEDLTARLEALARRVPEPQREPVADMKKAIRQHLQVGDDWEKVTLHFEKIHPQFFEQLRQQHPSLTPNDLKQCAYLKLNLTNKDIANLLNIEPNSVKIAHYRIKKKLGLPEESNLRDYILSV